MDRDFKGKVNQAARAWEIPQPTLFRYVHRRSAALKAAHLLKVAEFYGAHVDWLLTGRGWSPLDSGSGFVVWGQWERVVEGFKLPIDVRTAMLALPNAIASGQAFLVHWGIPAWVGPSVSEARRSRAMSAASRAQYLEMMAWTELLVGLSHAFGKARVRAKLIENVDRIRLGFQSFAMYLLDTSILPAEEVAPRFTTAHPEGQHPRHTVLLNWPPSPPLILQAGARLKPSRQPKPDRAV